MGEIKGFLKYDRAKPAYRPVEQRIYDFNELELPLSPEQIASQAARCMDCGVPFCHGFGCPLHNLVPEVSDLVWRGLWRRACEALHSTNNFPEITGRVCPALCEAACTLEVNDKPVSIRQIELAVVERGFAEGWIVPKPAAKRSGRKVAIVGSGPAGLAAAQQLSRAGHEVVVFEKDARIGGLLRYGIPDFKLGKAIIDRRLKQLQAEGVQFQTCVKVGEDISTRYLRKMFDCLCLAIGAGRPRDLAVPGRGYENILFAMDYLSAQNRVCARETVEDEKTVSARDRSVVIIGGGDTGSDCVGTARRQGAKEIYQLEILPMPPEERPGDTPWPFWPRIMRTSSSHEEGCNRMWSVMTKGFVGSETKVRAVQCCKVEWLRQDGGWKLKEVAGSEFELKADLVLIAMGFLHVEHSGPGSDLGLKLDKAGNISVEDFRASDGGVFAAGDAVCGASLVVRAMASGRQAATAIDRWLKEA